MLRKVTLPPAAGNGGALHLHSMPGRFEPLGEFLAAVENAGVSHVLCLVDDAEIAAKSPEYLAAIRAGSLPFKLHRIPIPDYNLPENPEALRAVLHELLDEIDRGESVAIHCAAGIGRTGMVATLLLTAMGINADEAAARVRDAGSSPDTPGQNNFIRQWQWKDRDATPGPPSAS